MSSLTLGGHVVDAVLAVRAWLSVFSVIGLVVIGFGVALFAVSGLIKGWAYGVNDTTKENDGAP